jgi:uncharacterized protein YcgI (DUF1989 family)
MALFFTSNNMIKVIDIQNMQCGDMQMYVARRVKCRTQREYGTSRYTRVGFWVEFRRQ